MVKRKLSQEHRLKLSKALSGKNHPMFGKKPSIKTREKISKSLTGSKRGRKSIDKQRKQILGENNPSWKGDRVGLRALHDWITKHLPKPKLCSFCNKKPPRDLANITGNYTRDFSNWLYLCRSCHEKYDKSKDFIPN